MLAAVCHCVESDLFSPREIRMSNLLSTARGFGKRAPEETTAGMYPSYRSDNVRSPLDLVGGIHKRSSMSGFLSTARGFGKRKVSHVPVLCKLSKYDHFIEHFQATFIA